MKRVRDIEFMKNVRQIHEFDFGVFYYFDGLVISEVNEGVVFRWKMAKKAVKAAHDLYGKDEPIVYISNRINNYLISPTDWFKFFKNRNQISFYSVVGKTTGSYLSIVIERILFRSSIPKFSTLEEAIDWSMEEITSKKSFF